MFDRYLDNRNRFGVTREMAAEALGWAEPLARKALGAHAGRDRLGLGDELPVVPVLSSGADNGGWGELMPVWFKPYERPVPLFVLDNWALTALIWQNWLGDIGPAYNIDNLLKVMVGSSLMIPFLPATQRGGNFLRHGALTVLLAALWLAPPDRDALLGGAAVGGRRFAEEQRLRDQSDLIQATAWVEAEAFMMAEGRKIAGDEKVRDFLADAEVLTTFGALYGGLCFSLGALYDFYGPDWEAWVFQAVNVHYRYATFGLEPWARWLGLDPTAVGAVRS
jgi:hypothetical protein